MFTNKQLKKGRTLMKDLTPYIKEAIEDLEAIDIQIGTVVDFKVNTRAKSRWGLCERVYGRGDDWKFQKFQIEISSELLQDEVSDIALMDTLIHELLHTCENCMKHTGEWKALAERVNSFYPMYNIKRCTSASEKGIKRDETNYKYKIVCQQCGCTCYYRKETKIVKLVRSTNRCLCGKCKSHDLKLFTI